MICFSRLSPAPSWKKLGPALDYVKPLILILMIQGGIRIVVLITRRPNGFFGRYNPLFLVWNERPTHSFSR